MELDPKNQEPVQEQKDKNQQKFQSMQEEPAEENSHLQSQSVQQTKPQSILERKFIAYQQAQDNKNKFLCNIHLYFQRHLNRVFSESQFNVHSVIPAGDKDRLRFNQIFSSMKNKQTYLAQELQLSLRESRGIASVMGMAIGDALGASTEFEDFKKQGLGIIKNSFKDIQMGIMANKIRPRSNKVAIWTDDASMGLCMADSILLNDYQFSPKHLRFMFIMWLQHGLNNGGRPYSIGLGGNISISMSEFMRVQQDYTQQGDRFNNGNGSLMRLAPVPVAYSNEPEKGVLYSGLQSKTTHNGLQAEECAKLMGKIIIELINRPAGTDGKQMLLKICDEFQSVAKSVQFLAKGLQQSQQYYLQCIKNKKFKKFNKSNSDRNWNWREKDHTYSHCRYNQQPGYIGSYCMDALSMALHTVMFSNSFVQVVAKNADMGGDCDTVGSIAGQIAGALYGIDQGMLRLYSQMQDFTSKRYDVFLKAYKLINRKLLQ